MKMLEFRLRFHWSLFLMGSINNNPALVKIVAWRRPGDKPLSEPRMESLLMHRCVTRPQWVKQPLNSTILELSSLRMQVCTILIKWLYLRCWLTAVAPLSSILLWLGRLRLQRPTYYSVSIYGMVSFLQNTYSRYPMACLWRQRM